MSRPASLVSIAYQNHADQIRSYIFAKMGCFQTAEDLTQETYIRLHNAGNLTDIEDMRSYLFRIAHNLVIDHFRAKNGKTAPREMKDIDEEYDLASDAPSVEDMILLREKISETLTAVGELSKLCQHIFWLSRAEGYRNHEIARMKNVCLSTVEKNLSRASRHCARHAAA